MSHTVSQVVTECSSTRFQSIKCPDNYGLLFSISPKLFTKLGPYLFGHWRGNISILNVTGVHFKSIQRSQCLCDSDCFTSENAGICDSGWSICHMPPCYIYRLATGVFRLHVKNHMSMEKLIILRDTVAIGYNVKRHSNILHFFGNSFSPESVSILLVNSIRIIGRFGKLNTKLVCAL